MSKKAWKSTRYPFCGCKFNAEGKRVERCAKHAVVKTNGGDLDGG